MAREQPHVHTSSCYKVLYPACGLTEHVHSGAACYRRDNTLKCSKPEHVHSRTACATSVGPTCGHR